MAGQAVQSVRICVRLNPLFRSAAAALHSSSTCRNGDFLIAKSGRKAKLLDGQKMAKAVRKEVAAEVKKMVTDGKRAPCLVAVVVGDNKDSHFYVSNKMKDAKKCGINARKLDKNVTQEKLLELLDGLNKDDEVDGILVQSPLPEGISEYTIFNSITPEKDVDGFNVQNMGKYCSGGPGFVPATPLGILEILKRCNVPTFGRNVCVVDRDKKVGFAVATLLHSDGTGDATTTICHEHTPLEQLSVMTKLADVIITGRGVPGLIKADMVKDGAVVIDFGIAEVKLEDGSTKLVGDVEFDEVSQVASVLTPALGGVWPVSIAMLMKNTLLAAQMQHIMQI